MDKKMKRYPIGHVVGFLSSLLLTFVAAGIALRTSLSFHTIMLLIGGLALVQAALQLFMFMHVNEGEDRKTQVINIAYGLIVAVIIVAGSIWVMSFGHHH
ncbi:cytochrome aa3 quinol oxidase subunit IV [Paenibacillus abyssi]|uniref:Quinol oxidase subunit 4 n=1 Tax=Paenibacillus abyssi TaxID=1340531 RepID=A0A917CTE8_9BACL|nr:cytochrome aa3 quinol oxidase subunit IV [Paenibacillus abyssi]GGF98259.1 cytochrome o ubiquinol oxidase subunit IV [Paenibacillus abyssi]